MFKRETSNIDPIWTLELRIIEIDKNKNIALRLTVESIIPCPLFKAEMKIINRNKQRYSYIENEEYSHDY